METINLRIVERHADEAAFLWERRERAARSPVFDLPSLGELDGRLEANLEGLALAGERGLAACLAALEAAGRRGSDTDGELFAAAATAAELGDTMAFAKLLVTAKRHASGARVIGAAIGWLSPARAARVLEELSAEACPPWLHRIAVAGYAARGEDPGALLGRAIASPDAGLSARACRAAGQLGRADLLPALRAAAPEPWAAWSAALLGDAEAAEALWSIAEAGGPAAEAACDLAARRGDAGEVGTRLAALAQAPGGLPAALAGAAARGDPACVPWVLDAMEARPELGRRALWVYATITGARPEAPLAVRPKALPPTAAQLERYLADPHADLPAPVPEALRAHWQAARLGLVDGARLLGGRPLDAAWTAECLQAGAQPWRASAALELALASPGRPLFPTRAPAPLQAARLRRG